MGPRQGTTERIPAGLCESCKYQSLIRSGRGSEFSMCRIGLVSSEWPKYPYLPVVECEHFIERDS
jgi:hypothetical protein